MSIVYTLVRAIKINRNIGLSCSILLCIFSISGSKAQTQGLLLNYFNIPDTIYFDNLIPVDFSITNTTNSNALGNLEINFRNESNDNIAVPLGGFEAVQFFLPDQEREFTTFIPVEPQYFIEGGNTVVIWPSFVGQPIPAVDSIRTVVFVLNINGTTSFPPSLNEEFFIPNPTSHYLEFIPKNGSKLPSEISVFSLTGKLVLTTNTSNTGIYDISALPSGMYIVRAKMSNEKIGYLRFVKH